MEAFKSALQDTEYDYLLVNEPNDMTVTSLRKRLKEKLANEIFYLLANSAPPLT
jgi:hypothetical protein